MVLISVDRLGDYITENGFSPETSPSSTVVGELINQSDQQVITDITFTVKEEESTGFRPRWSQGSDDDEGQANGSNTVFYTRKTVIAQHNYPSDATPTVDTPASTNDIRVDVLAHDSDTWTYGAVVTALDDRSGKYTLDSAPADNSSVFVTYKHYVARERPDTKTLQFAALQLGALQVWQNPQADIVQLVESYSVSGLSVSKGGQAMITQKAIDKYKMDYNEAIGRINGGAFSYDGEAEQYFNHPNFNRGGQWDK